MSPLALIALFGAGVSSIVAPCVLPLLPVYVTVVLDAAARGGRSAVIGSALHFVGGFTAVFVGLGLAAGAAGFPKTYSLQCEPIGTPHPL